MTFHNLIRTMRLLAALTVSLLAAGGMTGCIEPQQGWGMNPGAAAGASQRDSRQVVKRRLHLAGVGAQMLKNGGFEGEGGWTPYGSGFTRVSDAPHTGGWAARCDNAAAGQLRGARQTIELDQKTPAPILAEGWSRAKGVSGDFDSDYSLYLDLIYMDGTPLWGQLAAFHTGTHGWERQQVRVMPDKPVKTVTVYALFRKHSGTAWFDDLKLTELSGVHGGSFDGVVIDRRANPVPVERGRVGTLGGKEFSLQLNQITGRPLGVRFKGEPLPAGTGGVAGAGFFVRDAAADSDFYGLSAPLQDGGGGKFGQEGSISPLHLRLHTQYASFDDRVEVSGQVEDTSGKDRAVTVYYALPVAPAGLTWWDTLRESRSVSSEGVYSNTTPVGAGSAGKISLSPFSCLQSPGMGLSLDLPMDHPRVARVVYDAPAGQYYVAFDLGIVPGGPPPTFHFTVTATDPEWGLRAAARQYYQMFPNAFRRRVEKDGIWMPFSPISKIEQPEDFGFAFKEGNDETAWDDAHGVYTFRYTEPMSWWMTIPKGVERDYGVATAYLERYASGAEKNPEARTYALATKISGDFTADGRYACTMQDQPWAHGALFVDNCNPQIPDAPGQPNRAHVAWTPEIARSLYETPGKGTLDGEYLDSMEGWGTTRNFRRSQYPYETESLTFDASTGKPCILQAISNYEFARWLAADIHQRNKLMFANSTPSQFYWLSGLFDVLGTECHWMDGEQYRPDSDATMLYRREMADQKPYLLLQNSDFDHFSHEMVQRYMQRSLFYGIFPSMFSYNAADRPYWANPAWYNRDRNLFKQYIPIIQDLSKHGWQPVTRARTDDREVWVERFGGETKETPAFTVFNNASAPRSVVLLIDNPDVQWTLPDSFIDRISGQTLKVEAMDRHPTIHLTLLPGTTAALFPR